MERGRGDLMGFLGGDCFDDFLMRERDWIELRDGKGGKGS